MRIRKCVNGHYFDVDKFDCCRVCQGKALEDAPAEPTTTKATQVADTPVDRIDKTISLWNIKR